nr:MAG TPA: hypothetical protein [Bacteriophage sp.]
MVKSQNALRLDFVTLMTRFLKSQRLKERIIT